MRILVTGGSGNVGSRIIEELVTRGHDVVNLDHRQAREPRARFVFGDVRNRELLHRVFDGIDAVIHTAEIPHASFPLPANEIFCHNTAAGSAILQTAAEMKIKRVIYTSSFQVYGSAGEPAIAPLQLPMTEEHPLRPQNVYSASKVANEMYARVTSMQYGLSVAVIRLPWVLHRNISLETVEQRSQAATIGFEMGSHIHVDDAAGGFTAAVESARTGFEIYNLAGAESSSEAPVRELAQKFGLSMPKDWPDHKSVIDCGKAHEHLGWTATWSYWDQLAKQSQSRIS